MKVLASMPQEQAGSSRLSLCLVRLFGRKKGFFARNSVRNGGIYGIYTELLSLCFCPCLGVWAWRGPAPGQFSGKSPGGFFLESLFDSFFENRAVQKIISCSRRNDVGHSTHYHAFLNL